MRISARLVAAVVLEAAVLLGTIEMGLGIGATGMTGAAPVPAPSPGAPATPVTSASGRDSVQLGAEPPRPLQAPALAP